RFAGRADPDGQHKRQDCGYNNAPPKRTMRSKPTKQQGMKPVSNSLPAIIDLEASGFGRGSYPIEVGFALEDRLVYSFLIKPAPGWEHWSEEAEQVHGITRELLQRDGKSPREIALRMNE